jgi:hypothetical protein
LTSDRAEILADGEDVAVLKVEALDSQGRTVPDADDLIAFRVWGAGRLIGVGNGDPNCQESDKGPSGRFSMAWPKSSSKARRMQARSRSKLQGCSTAT